MKDDLAFKQSKRLGHTRQHFDIFNALANWAVDEAGGGEKVFGRKPEVAAYKPVDLGEEQGRATKSNLANIGGIQDFLEHLLPGYKNITAQEGKNILSLLRGEIPKDVEESVGRTAAFKAFTGGYGGSPMSRALKARDLGRTSLDMMDRGGNAAQRWMKTTEDSVAPYVISTPMQAETTTRNNVMDQATRQAKFNVAAAPDPSAAGIFNLQTALGSTAASMFSVGSIGGGGGGRGTGLGTGANPNASAGVTAGANAAAGYGGGYTSNYGPWDTGYRWGGG